MSTNTQEAAATLNTKSLGNFGVEIIGFDFERPVDAPMAQALLDLADRELILLFRGQQLSESTHVAFTEALGIIIPPVEPAFASATEPRLLRLGNVAMDGSKLPDQSAAASYGDGGEPWHSDGSFKSEPNYITLLHALEIPPERGDTWYASMVAAYENLSQDMKDRLEGLEMTHPYASENKAADGWEGTKLGATVHPLVRTIPGGQKALFLAHAASDGKIIGMDPTEGAALLQQLFDHATQEQFIYKHKWQLHDLLIWNNRGVIHSARGWDRSKFRRLMQRSETLAPRVYA
ncbi:MAG: TauD/TfdA family dioxygenase [Sphingobium sp.]|uniref:TauD/TfdA dioxygenase family protein n=1 Tax=Sphingobium sp. TaxID=1912891 RepID=UPI0029A75FDA|nr:TauD/TfdA family dioxygenase [Sphingobium sp.]MDX3911761.1 TauD/TfdA family dioxygenase [Sphingobium sp.]